MGRDHREAIQHSESQDCEDAPIWLMSCELSCTAGGVCRRSDAQTRGERDVPAVALEEVVEVRDEPEHPDIEASP